MPGQFRLCGSLAAAVSQDVTPPLITINSGSSSSTLTLAAGQSGTMQFTLGSAGTLSALVTFSCQGLPTGAQCIFSPSSVSPTGLPATVTVTITTTRFGIVGRNGFPSPWAFALVLPAVCLLPFASRRAKRRWLWIALGILLLLTLVLGVGCGGSSSSGITNAAQSTTPGTYPVTVTASSAGAVQGSMSFNLAVTR